MAFWTHSSVSLSKASWLGLSKGRAGPGPGLSLPLPSIFAGSGPGEPKPLEGVLLTIASRDRARPRAWKQENRFFIIYFTLPSSIDKIQCNILLNWPLVINYYYVLILLFYHTNYSTSQSIVITKNLHMNWVTPFINLDESDCKYIVIFCLFQVHNLLSLAISVWMKVATTCLRKTKKILIFNWFKRIPFLTAFLWLSWSIKELCKPLI